MGTQSLIGYENVLKLDIGDGGSILCECVNYISIKMLFFFKWSSGVLSRHGTSNSLTPYNYNTAKCTESKYFRVGETTHLIYPFLCLRPLFIISRWFTSLCYDLLLYIRRISWKNGNLQVSVCSLVKYREKQWRSCMWLTASIVPGFGESREPHSWGNEAKQEIVIGKPMLVRE